MKLDFYIIIKFSIKFFTIWGLIFHGFLLIIGVNNVNNGVLIASNMIILNNSLIGTYIMNKYKKEWMEATNLSSLTVTYSDILTHIIPAIYVLFYYKIFLENLFDFISFLFIGVAFPAIYLSIQNPEKVYRATSWTMEQFVTYSYTVLFINMILFQFYYSIKSF